MDTIARRLERAYPDTNKGYGVKLLLLSDLFVRNVRPALVVLFASVAFVLLIACANVANLMLTRATGRRREVAVRVALGGTRSRIIRQLLTESLLLSCLAGGAGLLIAQWGTSLLMNSLPAAVNPGIEVSPLSGPVFLFTLSVSLLIGLLFGLAPALQSSKFNLNESLREGGRAGTAGMARQRFRSAMVVAEVALSLVLLAGAGLLIESFVRLQQSNPGFRPDSILTMEMSLPDASYATDQQKAIFYDRLLAQVRSLPGISEAALVSALPLQGHSNHNSFAIEGRPEIRNLAEQPIADKRMITDDYFHLMGIQLLRGRAFTGADNESGQAVAIVDEATAKQYWPNEDPIGKRIHYYKAAGKPDRWLSIVGVVASVKQSRIDEPASSSVYVPFVQSSDTELALAVRGPVIASMVAGAVHAVDRDLPVGRIRTVQDIVDQSTGVQRFAAQLVGLFAAIALALAVIGTYGVVAYAVAQRTQEFGIRLALGASRGDVLKLVLRHGLILSAGGIALGLVAASAMTRLMAGMLFEVQASDPWILGSAAVILGAVAMFASYLPARRATRVDPMLALRYE
jgi:putative ABC transport system permease protein